MNFLFIMFLGMVVKLGVFKIFLIKFCGVLLLIYR